MAVQTLNISNFGQSGYLPDVAPTLLPQNGFSFARNWRFNEGGQARVTDGYTNAFDTRGFNNDPYDFGEENTELTFLYTWELNNQNAVVVYDSVNSRMIFTENNSTGDPSEYNLSVLNAETLNFEFTTGAISDNHFTITPTCLLYTSPSPRDS